MKSRIKLLIEKLHSDKRTVQKKLAIDEKLLDSILSSVSISSTGISDNTNTTISDPISIFKKQGIGSALPVVGLVGIITTLFADNIISKINEFADTIKSLTTLIPTVSLLPVNTFVETISETTETITSKFESIQPNISKLKHLSIPDIVTILYSGMDDAQNSIVEKLSSIQSKLSESLSTVFSTTIPGISVNNIIPTITTGLFSNVVASTVANLITRIGRSVLLSGIHATSTIFNLNSKWSGTESNQDSDNNNTKQLLTKQVNTTNDQDGSSTNSEQPNSVQSVNDSNGQTEHNPSRSEYQVSSGSWTTEPLTQSEVTSATIHPVKTKSGSIRWTSPRQWLRGFIAIESNGNPNAANKFGYQGLFQLYKGYSIFQRGNRFNANDNHRMAKAFWLTDCIPALRRKGVPISAISLYMTHQQGPSGGSTIMRNWMSGRNDVSGKASSRRHNGGVMGDVDFTNYWIRNMESRESSLRSITGSGGYDIVRGFSEFDERYDTVYVDNIPQQYKSNKPRTTVKYSIPYETNTSTSQSYSIESNPSNIIPPRIDSPTILNTTVSRMML